MKKAIFVQSYILSVNIGRRMKKAITVVIIWFFFYLAVIAGIICAVIHFISKYW